MGTGAVKNEGFDHMTVVVSDLDGAKEFFGLLGFVERIAVVAQGEAISRYMGIADWEADHVTLVLEGAPVHQEVQLLRFHHPAAAPDEGAGSLGAPRLQPRVLPGGRHGRHAGAPGRARHDAAGRHLGLPRPQACVHRRARHRRRVGRMVTAGPLARPSRSIAPPGGMAERTNAQLLKSCEVQASVGSNPTPSAPHHTLRSCGVARHRGHANSRAYQLTSRSIF